MFLELFLLLLPLSVALLLRPWRMLVGQSTLATPLLATLVLLPWVWALPALHSIPLQLQWSGACLVVLMLGWPLAVPVLVAVAAIAFALSPMTAQTALGVAVWQGTVPATFALALGWLIRRFIGAHMFVYILGRAFLGTVLCIFVAGALSQFSGHAVPATDPGLSLVARWLMAWGDGFVTGMLCAIFVAFRPHWLATWSDALYLRKPPAEPTAP